MKKWNWRRGLLGTGAMLLALVASLQATPALADDGRNVVLPEGVEFTGENTVYYEDKTPTSEVDKDRTGYYETLFDAICAVYMSNPGDATAELYCKPGADLWGAQQYNSYYHVADNLTIYGNGAYLSGGERCFEIDMYSYNRENMGLWAGPTSTEKSDLDKDVTLTVKSLDGIGLWGSRRTTHNVDVVFEDCRNMGRILQHTNYQPVGSGPNGTTDVTVQGCSFNAANGGNADWSIQMWVGGSLNVESTTFTGVGTPLYLDNQATEKSVVNLNNCTFVDCATKSGSSPIWLNGYNGTTTEAAMSGLKFEYSEGMTPGSDNAIVIGDKAAPTDTNISFTMSNTAAGIAVHGPQGTSEYTAKATDAVTGNTANDVPVVVTCAHPGGGRAVAKVEPTCTLDGVEAYWTCDTCGKLYSDAELKNEIDAPAAIKAPGHKTKTQGAKDATCTDEGYTGDEVCTVCNETVKKGEPVAKSDHAFGEWKVTEKATTDKTGSKERACEVCGHVETAELPKLGQEPEETLPQAGDASALIQLVMAATGTVAVAAGTISVRKRR